MGERVRRQTKTKPKYAKMQGSVLDLNVVGLKVEGSTIIRMFTFVLIRTLVHEPPWPHHFLLHPNYVELEYTVAH